MLAISQVINKILQSKDYTIVKKNGLDKKYFQGFEDEFTFIDEHVRNFGNVPDTTTFIERFPEFKLYEVNESDEYLLDRLYEQYGFNKFQPIVPKLSELLQVDSRDAYNFLQSQMQDLKPVSICNGIDIIKNAKERYDLYLERQSYADTATIKSGLPELDDIMGGWEYGEELVTVVARTNQGKSWLLLKFLAEAWKQGKRVGLYSGEMSHIKLGYRFDALFGHFSNKSLIRGAQTDGYDRFIDNLAKTPNPFIIITQKEFGGKPTVAKLRNFIEANNIEILGIDQYSLVADGRATSRDQTRIQYAHISEDLFLLSTEYKIPILGLVQANRSGLNAADDAAPGLEHVKESDDIAANSSKALGIKQSSFGLVLDVIKNREGKVGDKLLYSWDIDTGHFSYIPSFGDAAKPELRQQVQQQTKQQFVQNTSVNPF